MATKPSTKPARATASGSVDDLKTATKSRNGRIPKAKNPKPALSAPMKSKIDRNIKANNSAAITPEEPTAFKGSGGSHKRPLAKPKKRSPNEQRAEIERVAIKHGADLSEEAFNDVLRKVSKPHA